MIEAARGIALLELREECGKRRVGVPVSLGHRAVVLVHAPFLKVKVVPGVQIE